MIHVYAASTWIQPLVLRKFWSDYLKRNYLCGDALILVEKLENIDEIWDKLIRSFVKMHLLLQNKISTLENQNGLWKVFGDENIVLSIAMLLNTML